MSDTSSRDRGLIIAVVLIIVAVLAVLIGRGGMSNPFAGESPGESAEKGSDFLGDTTEIRAVIGSEKRAFFENPEVREALAEHGYSVRVDTAGSRHIANNVDLSVYDLAFPSSAPAAEKIAEQVPVTGRHSVFHSPMAIATFEPILGVLAEEGVAHRSGESWRIDMAALAALGQGGVRWRDIAADVFPSPRTVQVATTDIRSSNSAAMYLALMAWILNDNQVVSDDHQVAETVSAVGPFFFNQGYSESSSAGPFADYLSQGIGSKPMVMVYESQFLEETVADNSRITGDMTLAYPSPTVLSVHTALGLSAEGAEVARLLAEDPRLQELAGEHGYRPNDPKYFEAAQGQSPAGGAAPPNLVDSVDPPSYDHLEALINGVSASYGTPPPPEGTHEE